MSGVMGYTNHMEPAVHPMGPPPMGPPPMGPPPMGPPPTVPPPTVAPPRVAPQRFVHPTRPPPISFPESPLNNGGPINLLPNQILNDHGEIVQIPDMVDRDSLDSNGLGCYNLDSEILDLESLQDRFPRLKLAKSDRHKTFYQLGDSLISVYPQSAYFSVG